MKIKSIKAENFVGFSEVEINLDNNVTYLIGPNGSGKTTLGLNAIWFVLQGLAEKALKGASPIIAERFRFIGKTKTFANVTLLLEEEVSGKVIKISRKLTKNSTELKFESSDGTAINQDWLNKIFNVFLLSPVYFSKLSSREQALTLGIDVSSFDLTLKALQSELQDKMKKIEIINNIPFVPKVDEVDIKDLLNKQSEALNHNKIIIDKINLYNSKSNDLQDAKNKLNIIIKEFEEVELRYKRKIDSFNLEINDIFNFLNEPSNKVSERDLINIDPITTAIAASQVTNNKAFAYKAYCNSIKDLDNIMQEKEALLLKIREAKENKNLYLSKIGLKDGLNINDDGELLFNNKPIKEPYFSSGELIKIIMSINSNDSNILKFVYLQSFNLLDNENQKIVLDELMAKGYQALVEVVGSKPIDNCNCIILKDFTATNVLNLDDNNQDILNY